MTPADLISFGQVRHGRFWEKPLGKEIGWSYWKLHREAKKAPGELIDPKIGNAVKGLPSRPAATARKPIRKKPKPAA